MNQNINEEETKDLEREKLEKQKQNQKQRKKRQRSIERSNSRKGIIGSAVFILLAIFVIYILISGKINQRTLLEQIIYFFEAGGQFFARQIEKIIDGAGRIRVTKDGIYLN